jgi:hypothetical protein
MVEYKTLVRNAVLNARPYHGNAYRWSVLTHILAVGSTTAHEICREFGKDPDEMLEQDRCEGCPIADDIGDGDCPYCGQEWR